MNVVITGASRGLGRSMASEFVRNGDTVLALARSVDALAELDEDLMDAPGKLIALVVDIAEEDDVALIGDAIDQEMGSVDILINNAGAIKVAPFTDLGKADWQHIYGVNVFGLVGVTQVVLPRMTGAWGHVVNISSMGGVMGSAKFAGLSAYSSSKGAVSILTECLAEEYKDSPIRVNGLALGACSTEMLAEAFPGYEAPIGPDELGSWVVNFASTAHRVMNGKNISLALTTP